MTCADAIFNLLTDWDVVENIVAMCFDTTASNTGVLNEACLLLEQKIGRPLLTPACRHHVLEIVLAAVFSTKLGRTNGPILILDFSTLSKGLEKLEQRTISTRNYEWIC